MDYISKKELLAMTGISYGQLYRWKREGLIPEEWFNKQSSYTGQETFFPREEILSRVRAILEMKGSHSLDELAVILSPAAAVDASINLCDVKELAVPKTGDLAKQLGRVVFSLPELSFMLSLLQNAEGLSMEEYTQLVEDSVGGGLDSTDYNCVLFRGENKLHSAFYKGGEQPVFSQGISVICAFRLGAAADIISTKYLAKL